MALKTDAVFKGGAVNEIGIFMVISSNGVNKEIRTTDFDITQDERHELFKNGVEAAQTFLKTWDFQTWRKNTEAICNDTDLRKNSIKDESTVSIS